MKFERTIKELKKEFTEKEAGEIIDVFIKNFRWIDITAGATIAERLSTKRKGTAASFESLFGFPYISNSVNNEAAALWNTNTSAQLITGASRRFDFLGLAISEKGEALGIFQEKTPEGEEVGGVRCLLLESLGDFSADISNKEHEKAKREKLQNLNNYRATVRDLLPKACEILEKYRGKRWGAATLDKIREELQTLNREGVSVWPSVSNYWVDIKFTQGQAWARSLEFSFQFDQTKNTPAEEIKPRTEDLQRVAAFDIKEHRAKVKEYAQDIERTASKLKYLIELYREEVQGKGYKVGDRLSVYGVDLPRLTARELDE